MSNYAPFFPNSFYEILSSFNISGNEFIINDKDSSLKWLFESKIDLTFLHFFDFNNYDNNGK